MVTPYPPVRDGIASYAQQSVAALRAAGHDVEVLSPGPSAAHHHLDLVGSRGALALAKRVRRYDKIVVQFHPDFFYPQPSTERSRLEESLALLAAFRLAREVEVVVHEVDYRHGRGWTPAAVAMRQMWRQVDRITVHSTKERTALLSAFGPSAARVVVADHGSSFTPFSSVDRSTARERLGIDQDAFCFLSIGFVQPHKGFDRAIRAFRGLTGAARLDVVGSVRVEDPAFVSYAAELEDLAQGVPGAHVHLGYVSDENFDRWIIASDVVVLPYREIWSSGVLERARLLGRPVIATRVGALSEQSAGVEGVRLVENDDELRAAMYAAAGGARPAAHASSQPWLKASAGRAAIQAQVLARAAAERGGPLGATSDVGTVARTSQATAPLRRLGDVQLTPVAGRRGTRTLVQRVVRRLTAWQLQPMVDQINSLRRATLASIESVASRDASRPGGDS